MKKIIIALISIGATFEFIATSHAVVIHSHKIKQPSIAVKNYNPTTITRATAGQGQTPVLGSQAPNATKSTAKQGQTLELGNQATNLNGNPSGSSSGNSGSGSWIAPVAIGGGSVTAIGAGGHLLLNRARNNADKETQRQQALEDDRQQAVDLRTNPDVQKAIDLQRDLDEYKNMTNMQQELQQLGKNLNMDGEFQKLKNQQIAKLRQQDPDLRVYASKTDPDLSLQGMKKSLSDQISKLEKSPNVSKYRQLADQQKSIDSKIDANKEQIEELNEKDPIVKDYELNLNAQKYYKKQLSDIEKQVSEIDENLASNQTFASDYRYYEYLLRAQKGELKSGEINPYSKQQDLDKEVERFKAQNPEIVKGYQIKTSSDGSRTALNNKIEQTQEYAEDNQNAYDVAKQQNTDQNSKLDELQQENEQLQQKSDTMKNQLEELENNPDIQEYKSFMADEINTQKAVTVKNKLNDLDVQASQDAENIMKSDPKFARYYNLERRIDVAKNQGAEVEIKDDNFKGPQYELTQSELNTLKQNPNVDEYFKIEDRINASNNPQTYRFANIEDENKLTMIREKIAQAQPLTSEEKDWLKNLTEKAVNNETIYSSGNRDFLNRYLANDGDPYRDTVTKINNELDTINSSFDENTKVIKMRIKGRYSNDGLNNGYKNSIGRNEELINDKQEVLNKLKSLNSDSPETQNLITRLEGEINQGRSQTNLLKELSRSGTRNSTLGELQTQNSQKIKAIEDYVKSGQADTDAIGKEALQNEYAGTKAKCDDLQEQITKLGKVSDNQSAQSKIERLQDELNAEEDYLNKMDELVPGLKDSEAMTRKIDLNRAYNDFNKHSFLSEDRYTVEDVTNAEQELTELYDNQLSYSKKISDIQSEMGSTQDTGEISRLQGQLEIAQDQLVSTKQAIKVTNGDLIKYSEPDFNSAGSDYLAVKQGAKLGDIKPVQNKISTLKQERVQLKSKLNELQNEQSMKKYTDAQDKDNIDRQVKELGEQQTQIDQQIQEINQRILTNEANLKEANIDQSFVKSSADADSLDLDRLVRIGHYPIGQLGKVNPNIKFDIQNLTTAEQNQLANEFSRMSTSVSSSTEGKSYQNLANDLKQRANLQSRSPVQDFEDSVSKDGTIKIDNSAWKQLRGLAEKDSNLANVLKGAKGIGDDHIILSSDKDKFYQALKDNYNGQVNALDKKINSNIDGMRNDMKKFPDYNNQSEYDSLQRYRSQIDGLKNSVSETEPIKIDDNLWRKLQGLAEKDSDLEGMLNGAKVVGNDHYILANDKEKFYQAFEDNYKAKASALEKQKVFNRNDNKNLMKENQQLNNNLKNMKQNADDLKSQADSAKARQQEIDSKLNGDAKDAELRQQVEETEQQIAEKDGDINKAQGELEDARWKKPLQQKLEANLTESDRETLSKLIKKMNSGEALSPDERAQLQKLIQKARNGLTDEQSGYLDNTVKAKIDNLNSLKSGQQGAADSIGDNSLNIGVQGDSETSSLSLGDQGTSPSASSASGLSDQDSGAITSQEQGSEVAGERAAVEEQTIKEEVTERTTTAELEERAEAEVLEEMAGA